MLSTAILNVRLRRKIRKYVALLRLLRPEVRIIDGHRRLLPQTLDSLLRELRAHFLLDLGACFIERLRLVLLDQNDVITEPRLYGFGNLAHRPGKGGLVERRDHLA